MTDSIQYDVKVVVTSALKLLPEIKCLLSSNPNRLNLFRRTVFGPWLDLPSHYNDNHLMYYVLQDQVMVLFQALQAYGLLVDVVCPGRKSRDICRTAIHQTSNPSNQ
ncbi:hypothetical protein Tco_1250152, partial [Tanacetum coccineum]